MKTLKRVYWYVVRVAVALVPMIGYFIALKVALFPALWPPLGSFDRYGASTTTFIIAVIGWAGPEAFKTKADGEKALRGSLIVGVVAFLSYVFLLIAFVKRVEPPGGGTQFRSIGYQRSAEVKKKFPYKSDGELLEIVGLEDKDIERAWTSGSVTVTRFALAITYFFLLASFNLAIGLYLKRLSGPLVAAIPPP